MNTVEVHLALWKRWDEGGENTVFGSGRRASDA